MAEIQFKFNTKKEIIQCNIPYNYLFRKDLLSIFENEIRNNYIFYFINKNKKFQLIVNINK